MESRAAPAIPHAYRPQTARETPSRFGPKRRDSEARLRPRRDVAAVSPREHPCNRRQARIPCPKAPAPMADPMPHASAPPTRNPPRRSLDAQGRTPAGGRQGPRHFFGFFAHALRARTTRKTAVGRLLFPCPTSLPPLPARPRCMRLTRRKARHRGGPQSLRSTT